MIRELFRVLEPVPASSDPLEAELYTLRDQIDRVLLLPDRSAAVA